jgi:hypothetical protein
VRWSRDPRDPDNTITSQGYAVMRCTGTSAHRFLAFKILGSVRTVLGGFDSGAEARDACAADLAKRMESAA